MSNFVSARSAVRSSDSSPVRQAVRSILACTTSLCLAAAFLLLAGCKSEPVKQGGSEMSVPADFAIQLRVHGKAGAKDIAQQTADYVVEPNRAFRVAGASWGAQGRVFPPLLRYLDYKEYDSLYRLVESGNLAAEPTSPNGELASKGKPATDAWFEVTVTLRDRTHSYTTTGAESPPTSQLLVRLHELRSGRRIGAATTATPATKPVGETKK